MKGLTWLALLLVWAMPVFSLHAEEEQKGIPPATQEEEDYPIITDEDYPYLEEDTNAPKTEEITPPVPTAPADATPKPQN